MSYFRYGVQSCNKGNAIDHISYITRHGSHASRADLVYTEHGNMPPWATTPENFWRAADRYERKNGVALRQITVSLPNLMTQQENVALARRITIELAGIKPYQMAVHMPSSSLEHEPNPHVHIAICERVPDGIERDARQMFGRFNPRHPENGGCRKDSCGLTPMQLRHRVLNERHAVAEITNDDLARNGYAERVDSRSLREQGISRAPERYLGQAQIRTMTHEAKEDFVAKRRHR